MLFTLMIIAFEAFCIFASDAFAPTNINSVFADGDVATFAP
jgi:hypothetical protein